MRLAVCADDPGAVDSKQHRQLLDSHIMDHLIVGSLQEGGVDRHHRLVVANRQPGGEGDRMLLGNGDVKVPIGNFFENSTIPEPSRIAGVIAISLLSLAAVSHSQSPKIFE